MTKDEALKMAIEALETYVPHYGFDANWHKAINACKEALATNEESLLVQPAQEPKCSKNPDAPHGFCRDASHSAGRYVCECEGWEAEQPAQEPHGWVYEERIDDPEHPDGYYWSWGFSWIEIESGKPVYTHPAPSWQGLSDSDFHEAHDIEFKRGAAWAEQALKEKNT